MNELVSEWRHRSTVHEVPSHIHGKIRSVRRCVSTYAFYSFNMIMYGAILSFGSAAILYGVNPN